MTKFLPGEEVVGVWYRVTVCEVSGRVVSYDTLELTNKNRLLQVKEPLLHPPTRGQVKRGPGTVAFASDFARLLNYGPMVQPGTDRTKYLARYPEAREPIHLLTEEERRTMVFGA